MKTIILLASALLLCVPGFASDKFKKVGTCGSAKVLSGDTCSNVKVAMTFDSCTAKLEPQNASRIVCEGNKIKARYTNGQYRYEAVFNKKDDGWGGVEWTPDGAMTESEKIETGAKVAKAPTEEKAKVTAANAPIPAVPPPAQKGPEEKSVPAPAADIPFKMTFSGFADLRFTSYAIHDDTGPAGSGNAESGWGVEDGAFYATFEKEKLSLVIDIPFRRLKTQDDVDHTATQTAGTGATSQNASNSSTIIFGADKAQIYAKYKFNDYFAVDMGQFDTIYGVELNDSKDRVFGKTGLVYDAILPVTHTGAMGEFSWKGIAFKAFSANPNNKGTYGDRDTTTANGDKPEYGAALGYSNDLIRAQIGYMSRLVYKPTGTDTGPRTLTDATLGATWKDLSIDFEYASVADANKNTLTSTDSGDMENAGDGGLVLLSYKVMEPMLLGVRYEKLRNDPGAASLDTAEDYAASIHWKVSPQLELRSEYMAYKYIRLDGTDWNATRFSVASLITF